MNDDERLREALLSAEGEDDEGYIEVIAPVLLERPEWGDSVEEVAETLRKQPEIIGSLVKWARMTTPLTEETTRVQLNDGKIVEDVPIVTDPAKLDDITRKYLESHEFTSDVRDKMREAISYVSFKERMRADRNIRQDALDNPNVQTSLISLYKAEQKGTVTPRDERAFAFDLAIYDKIGCVRYIQSLPSERQPDVYHQVWGHLAEQHPDTVAETLKTPEGLESINRALTQVTEQAETLGQQYAARDESREVGEVEGFRGAIQEGVKEATGGVAKGMGELNVEGYARRLWEQQKAGLLRQPEAGVGMETEMYHKSLMEYFPRFEKEEQERRWHELAVKSSRRPKGVGKL